MFYGLMAAFAALIVGLDQLTKWLVIKNVPLHSDLGSVLGIFHITHTKNTGAAWGMLEGQTWLFVLVMVLFVALIALIIWRKWVTKKFELVCLASILGGGLGNMIDRVFRNGIVTDMIEFDFVQFPVFNVADCFITLGCFALLIYVLFVDRPGKEKSTKE